MSDFNKFNINPKAPTFRKNSTSWYDFCLEHRIEAIIKILKKHEEMSEIGYNRYNNYCKILKKNTSELIEICTMINELKDSIDKELNNICNYSHNYIPHKSSIIKPTKELYTIHRCINCGNEIILGENFSDDYYTIYNTIIPIEYYSKNKDKFTSFEKLIKLYNKKIDTVINLHKLAIRIEDEFIIMDRPIFGSIILNTDVSFWQELKLEDFYIISSDLKEDIAKLKEKAFVKCKKRSFFYL